MHCVYKIYAVLCIGTNSKAKNTNSLLMLSKMLYEYPVPVQTTLQCKVVCSVQPPDRLSVVMLFMGL